ncbi:hypothetical protein L9F63_009043, partial [Diploptera punctata]
IQSLEPELNTMGYSLGLFRLTGMVVGIFPNIRSLVMNQRIKTLTTANHYSLCLLLNLCFGFNLPLQLGSLRLTAWSVLILISLLYLLSLFF